MSDIHDNDVADFAPQSSPGDLLKRERERQGMPLDEVATALNLRPAVVRGLESDNYDEVPVAAYRRGYLRAYSRLLGIDDKPVITAYNNRFGGAETDRKVTPVHVTKPPSKLGAWLFKLVTLLVIVALIALTLLWWQSREGTDLLGMGGGEPVAVDTLDGTTITEGEADSEPLPPLPDDESDLGLVDDAPLTGDDALLADDPLLTDDAQPSVPADEPTGDPLVEAPALAEAPSEEGLAGEATAEDEPAVGDLADAASAEIEEAAAADDDGAADPGIIQLTFNEQSWTEIFDAGNQRVFVGLQEPGTQATVEGEPPFRLTVGNATGVELRYLGDQVDLVGYAGSNNVARFTLGE
ncbi:transcriptional regulator, XRE family [Franzmannia pantelleriensis]|uniref:Transcriptional regulator, XRE family n=1 Tax=Franzmannia pantelleriensis TaxID=48727 RepID=A0A1G9S5Y2_9GAMM|nr:RodZ domain-containing protein [Halomonas pantelleriensis]SDM30886.1 transcriptional regulator, XRE family [Halomonas pantelleriensis]